MSGPAARVSAIALAIAAGCAAPASPTPSPAPRPPRGGDAYVDAYRAAPAAPTAARLDRAPGRVTSVDDRTGAPRFVWARRDAAPPAAPTPAAAALAYVAASADAYGLDADALATIEVTRVHDLG